MVIGPMPFTELSSSREVGTHAKIPSRAWFLNIRQGKVFFSAAFSILNSVRAWKSSEEFSSGSLGEDAMGGLDDDEVEK